MITLRELLEDPVYRSFFKTKPALPKVPRRSPPWRLFVQREMDGRWSRKDFWTYAEAFNYLRQLLGEIHDAAICSRGVAFKPPHKTVRVTRGGRPIMIRGSNGKLHPKTKIVYWRPRLEAEDAPHTWCPYCRRPVIVKWFSKHHSFKKDQAFDPGLQRCPICGASELLMIGVR